MADRSRRARSLRAGGAASRAPHACSGGGAHRAACTSGGFTLAELVMGLVVFVITAAVLLNHLQVNYSATRAQQDRVFAYTKAQTILAEMQAYVDRGAAAAAIELDALDDGVVNRPTLTITTVAGALVLPDHPLSGNFQRDGQWVWARRITVRPFAGLNNRNVRYVTVQIYKRDLEGNEHVQAALSSVVNSVGSAFPTTQVFDLYLLAVENIPGWWVFMEAMVPFVESAVTDLQSRNPGLSLRTHWISKASYGRNPVYRPYVNDAVDSNQQVDWVYYYPGRMPAGNASVHYYVPDLVKARISVDGTERHGYDADLNEHPYALADFYNHAMRLPRERALHDARAARARQRKAEIAAAKLSGGPVPPELDDMSEEPTLRLLLEDMATDPDKYRHALLMNLHGELLPMPSLRNYSDAAKAPETAALRGMRVVTHPEELRTKRDPLGTGIDDVVLRVYAYKSQPNNLVLQPALKMPDNAPIAVQVMGLKLVDGSNDLLAGVQIQNLRGGIMLAGLGNTYAWSAAKRVGDGTLVSDEMYYDVSWVPPSGGQDGFTLFKLHNTPVVAPLVGTQGLPATTRARLYNLEYVPSSPGSATFGQDLTHASVTVPKNTARWKITIPSTVFANANFVDLGNANYDPDADVVLTMRTRIWDPSLADDATRLATGTMYPVPNQPENLSETYTWWADSPSDVPITERSQFQGDPRHNPYKDLLGGAVDFPHGYNWYWDSLTNGNNSAADYLLDTARLRNRWLGRLRQDCPRFFQLLRTAVVNSGAVYTTLTGFSYYYMGFGNEIGYDASNGYAQSIPTHLKPWGIAGTGHVDSITGDQGNSRFRTLVRNGGAGYWISMPWLGELYPDQVHGAAWTALDGGGQLTGNLPSWNAAAPATTFYRQRESTAYGGSTWLAYGTTLHDAQQRTNAEGCTTFFNIGTSGSTFHHQYGGGTGTLVGAGLDLRDRYNFPMLTTADINRPFRLTTNADGGVGDEWSHAPYATKYTAALVKTYYNHGSGAIGSGLVRLTDPGNTSSAFIVVNGLSMAVASGSSFIAKFSLLSQVQSLFEAGDAAVANRIKRPPQVTIEAPTEITELIDPATIDVQFDVAWRRWDGLDYTGTSLGATELESEVEYVIMYSRDNGASWLHVDDSSAATPGVKPTNVAYLHADAGAGAETYVGWNVSGFPQGSYLLRVEAYRANQALHYSQHQVKIFIQR